MTYQSVWWHPNYIEYGSGLNAPKTWPNVMEQYRRPHALYDLRYYDLPEDRYQAKLYYNVPRMGKPQYRATFRDKPHTVPRYYPEGWPEGQPPGFHGRMYYEDGPPQFKYDGPKQDKLYWLERPPYLPTFPKQRPISGNEKTFNTMRGLNMTPHPPESTDRIHQDDTVTTNATYGGFHSRRLPPMSKGDHNPPTPNPTKRLTQDGVGYL